MKKFAERIIVVAVVVLFSAGFGFAEGNIGIDNSNTFTGTQTVTANPTANASVTGVSAEATGGKSIVAGSGNSTLINTQQREFVGLPAGGLQLNLIAPSTKSSHRTNESNASVVEYGYFTQESYDSMQAFLQKVHDEMDSNTRTWKELRKDLVIQPRFDHPRTALTDKVPVRVFANGNYSMNNIMPKNVVGYLTVRDRKPQDNSVDSMYFVVALYPVAKMGGANVLIKIDNYFWSNVNSNSWGMGVGGGWSQILSCLTGFSAAGNLGYNQGKAAERVAGGEMYLALYIPDAPAPIVAAPPCVIAPVPPVVIAPEPQPQVKTCNPSSIWSRIEELKKSTKECTRWCINNLRLRSRMGEAYIDLYQCTGDKRHLSSAIEQFQIAERNYLKGHDIKANQAEADQLIAQDYYLWAGCINALQGQDAADQFAVEKRVEKIPQL